MGGMESYRSVLDPNSLEATLPNISFLLANAIKG